MICKVLFKQGSFYENNKLFFNMYLQVRMRQYYQKIETVESPIEFVLILLLKGTKNSKFDISSWEETLNKLALIAIYPQIDNFHFKQRSYRADVNSRKW